MLRSIDAANREVACRSEVTTLPVKFKKAGVIESGTNDDQGYRIQRFRRASLK
jgi:hypothetical protein